MKHKLMVMLALGVGFLLMVPPASVAQTGLEEQGTYRLSRAECLRTALENNLDLVSSSLDPKISEQQIRFQNAAFDPGFSALASADETVQNPADPFQPDTRKNKDLNATIDQNLKFGADYSATFFVNENDAPGFNVRVLDLPLGPQAVDFNPFYTAGFDLRYNQPLLRGLGREATQEQLLLRTSDLKISEEEFLRQAQQTIELTEGAYWDVLAAKEAVRVSYQSLDRAGDLLELNEKKVAVGTLAPIEITQAEAGVASSQEQVIIAETDLGNAEDNLRAFMAIPAHDPRWNQSIVITDKPQFDAEYKIDLEAAIVEGMQKRPEMSIVREQLRQNELTERVSRNTLKHGLDLALRASPFGDSDNSIAAGPIVIPIKGDLGDALDKIFDADTYTWSASLTYSVPIGNRQAKANLRTAQLNTQKGMVNVSTQSQTVHVEIRAAAREVDAGIRRVQAARKNVELQEKKLDAEQKKFDNGMSTSFEVLTFQQDLNDAELSRIRAGLTYVKARVAFERSKGTLLEARHLRIEE